MKQLLILKLETKNIYTTRMTTITIATTTIDNKNNEIIVIDGESFFRSHIGLNMKSFSHEK